MKKLCYETQYDVTVAGGGVSGTVAVIATDRMGVKALIVEQSGYLSGVLTGCGVGPITTLHAGKRQVIRGIMEEIVGRLKNDGYSTGHIYDTMQYTSYLTPFNAEGLKVVLDEMMEKAGYQILFYIFIDGTEHGGGRIIGLAACNKGGTHKLEVVVHIDGTGDGDMASSVGAPMIKGRESDGAAQSMIMNMKYVNVDTVATKNHIRNHIEDSFHHQGNEELMDTMSRSSFCGFQEESQVAEARGELEIKREDALCFRTDWPSEYIVNTTRIIEHDAVNVASLSDVEVVGRRQCRQPDRFLRSYIPGFEHALPEFTGPNVGVRGSRQLSGKYTLAVEGTLKCREFDNVIVHLAYPIDIHNLEGLGTDSRLLSEKGTYYSIPYETPYCEDITNLLVAGRCIPASFEAQAAIRMTPTAGTLGHAAGVAAVSTAQATKSVAGAEARCYGEVVEADAKELQRHLVAQDVFPDLKE